MDTYFSSNASYNFGLRLTTRLPSLYLLLVSIYNTSFGEGQGAFGEAGRAGLYTVDVWVKVCGSGWSDAVCGGWGSG
jgi:hypothetical protein